MPLHQHDLGYAGPRLADGAAAHPPEYPVVVDGGHVAREVWHRLVGTRHDRASTRHKLPREIAGFDSASGMVVTLVRFLHGQDTPPRRKPAFRALRPVAARLPERTRQWIYSMFSGAEGRRPEELAALDADVVAAAIAGVFPRRRYPAVVIDSSNGALTHLCAAMGVPWLPQTVLLPVRQQSISPNVAQQHPHAGCGDLHCFAAEAGDVRAHFCRRLRSRRGAS